MGCTRMARLVALWAGALAPGCGGESSHDGPQALDASAPQTTDGRTPDLVPSASPDAGGDAGGAGGRTISWNAMEETITSGVMQQFQVGFNNTTIAARLPDGALLVIWSKDGALGLGRRA